MFKRRGKNCVDKVSSCEFARLIKNQIYIYIRSIYIKSILVRTVAGEAHAFRARAGEAHVFRARASEAHVFRARAGEAHARRGATGPWRRWRRPLALTMVVLCVC